MALQVDGRSRLDAASPSQKVVDEDDHCDDEQEMNEGAADVEAEAEQPEDDQNDDNCPKHMSSSPIESVATLKSRRHYAAFVMVRCRVESMGCPAGGRILMKAQEIDATKDVIC